MAIQAGGGIYPHLGAPGVLTEVETELRAQAGEERTDLIAYPFDRTFKGFGCACDQAGDEQVEGRIALSIETKHYCPRFGELVFCRLEDRSFTEPAGANKEELRALLDGLDYRRYFLFPIRQFICAQFASIFKRVHHCTILYNTKMCNANLRRAMENSHPSERRSGNPSRPGVASDLGMAL